MNKTESPASTPLRIAVIGGGAFGKNHLRVFSELAADSTGIPIVLAALVESDDTRRRDLATRYGIASFSSVDDLLQSGLALDAATICVPTVAHAAVATQLLEAGLDVLIEKPITTTLAEADALLSLASARNRLIAVGHLERFNPAVTACFSRLTRPMFFEAHRLSIFTPRSLDVDVVLDLMIHDLDLVLSFCRCGVREVRAVGLPILSSRVDIANARVELDTGCIANFTASRVSTEQVRKLRLFQPRQYLSLDFARQELLAIQVETKTHAASSQNCHPEAQPKDLLLAPAHFNAEQARLTAIPTDTLSSPPERETGFPGQLAVWGGEARSVETSVSAPAQISEAIGSNQPIHPSPGLSLEKVSLTRAEPLRLELEDFLHAIRGRTAPRVTGEAGRAALALALEITREINTHAQRSGLA